MNENNGVIDADNESIMAEVVITDEMLLFDIRHRYSYNEW
jgi:hypothetical protein